jgi:hypothetical protein
MTEQSMTHSQWLAGSFVIAMSILGCTFTAPWAERRFSLPEQTEATHTRTCVTVDGKRFEWDFPNPPFGTQSCPE